MRGEKSVGEMVEDLMREIHMLAKRQETYFRGMQRRGLPVQWVGTEITAEELEQRYTAWKQTGFAQLALSEAEA